MTPVTKDVNLDVHADDVRSSLNTSPHFSRSTVIDWLPSIVPGLQEPLGSLISRPKNVKATICLKCMVLLWASLFQVTSSLWHPLILPPHRPLRDACGPPLSLCQYPSTSVPACVCAHACVCVSVRERENVCVCTVNWDYWSFTSIRGRKHTHLWVYACACFVNGCVANIRKY